jgi:hypothetical protein
MAAPGEFFPQQFAMGILNLAQQHKQFNARLREQRATAAARNFMEKERLDLAERQMKLQESKANPREEKQFGQIDAFRQKSAEGAMGVRDQLALMQGQRQIERQSEIEKQVDDGLPQKISSDFETYGRAFVPANRTDLIPVLRASVGAGGTGLVEEVKRTGDGLVTTGKTSGSPGGAAAAKVRKAKQEAGLPVHDVVEMPVKGGTMVIRVGGATVDQQKDALAVKKLNEEISSTQAKTALVKMQTESTSALKEYRLAKAKQAARGIGADRANYYHFRTVEQYSETAQNMILNEMKPLQEERAVIEAALVGLAYGSPAHQTKSKELAAVVDQLSVLEEHLTTDASDYLKTKNKDFQRIAEALPVAQRAGALSAAERAAGRETPPDPDIEVDKDVKDVMSKNIADRLYRMSLDPSLDFDARDSWKILPATINLPFRGPGGTPHSAAFYASADGKNLIPLNRLAAGLASRIEKARKAGRPLDVPVKAQALQLHPAWRQMGWSQATDTRPPGPSTAGVTLDPDARPENVKAADQKADDDRKQKMQRVMQLISESNEAELQGEDISGYQTQIKDLSQQLSEE